VLSLPSVPSHSSRTRRTMVQAVLSILAFIVGVDLQGFKAHEFLFNRRIFLFQPA
jgi:uncharacterized membrane protein YbjE (DUF340 family)